EKGMIYMVTGGHTDPVTGTQCHWTTFRICTTTYMLAAGLADTLYKKFGGKSYLIKAQQSKPDVLIVLVDGQDLVNCMKQAAQFGLTKKFPIGGGLSELEVL